MRLFGYGITNKAIAEKFKNCKIYDDKFETISFDEFGNELIPSNLVDFSSDELSIITPGIPPYNSFAKNCKNLVSEYDFFYKDFPFSIWISGTNGKTTTTAMIEYLLKDRGGVAGGNIGIPLAKLPKTPIWILETSSFTLHYTKVAKPNIYVLLPITDDHITWHGGFSEYEEAKLKPLKLMEEGEVVILPKKYQYVETNGYKICYENSKDLAIFMGIDITKLNFKEPFLLDAILALSVTKVLFDEINYDLINSFKIGAHKIEEFFDNKNRVWIDDSKATNLDATIEAMKNFIDKRVLLILGGDDKGANLEPLFEFLKDLDIKIFAIGSNSEKLLNLANKFDIPILECKFLDVAVKAIDCEHTTDSVALLSPSAASLDQFNSYKDRGEKFKSFVYTLSSN